jgi:glycosyltransferase involved in cell wall biosynthesis
MTSPKTSQTPPDGILKVLHVTRSEELGIRMFLLGLFSRNDPKRFSLELAGPLVGPLTADLPGLNVTPLYCPLERDVKFPGDLRAFFSLWKTVRRERPDVLHLHGAKSGFLGRIVGFLQGVPAVVYTPNNNYLDAPMPALRRRVLIFLEKCVARLGGQIVSVSATEKASWLERGICRLEQISVIFDGFDFSRASALVPRAEAKRTLGIPQERQVVGMIARLVPQKAAHIFLQAAARVLRRQPDTCFLLVGDGPLRADLEKLASDLHLGDRVLFAGFRSDLSPVYSAMDVSVLTSLYEGLPMVVLESMYLKIPVVSSRTQGATEVLTAGCGVVTPIGDPEATAEAMLSLLRDPALARELAAHAHTRVVAEFGAENMAAQYQDLYQRLAMSRSPRREPRGSYQGVASAMPKVPENQSRL